MVSRQRLTEQHMPLDINALSHSAATHADQHASRRDQDFHWRQV
jgi:hypothetical protein